MSDVTSDVVVVGAGLAGLTAALRLREAGARVTLATFGVGGLPLSQGTVDVLGYRIDAAGTRGGQFVERPYEAFDQLPAEHPYHVIGADAVRQGVADLVRLAGPELLQEPGEQNHVVPTAVGVLRPTLVVQPSMAADLRRAHQVLVVGIGEFKDFHATYAAANLQRVLPDATVRAVEVAFQPRDGEADPTGLVIARALDVPAKRDRLVAAIKPHLGDADLVVLPAVLGAKDPGTWRAVSQALGVPVVEAPCLPPSVPGIRLDDHLVTAVKKARVRWILGSRVVRGSIEAGRLASLELHTSGSPSTLRADSFVLATGGFESGALALDSYGTLSETALGLPVWRPEGDLVHGDYLGSDQPLFRSGIRTDEHMRPLGEDGRLVAENLYAAGGLLAGALRWSEKSGDGIAVGSAVKATNHILEGRA